MANHLTRQCAWCKRVYRDGAWTALTEPPLDPWSVTHGMCPDCADRYHPGLAAPETPPPVPAPSPTREP